MNTPNRNICETIIKLKTSILVIEQQKKIADKLASCLVNKHSQIIIKSKNLKGKCHIKPFDIYVINSEEYKKDEKYQIIRKILENNKQANIFLLNDTDDERDIINNKFMKILHPFKSQVVNAVISCNDIGLQIILDTIESVENCKYKLYELWNKLEKSI